MPYISETENQNRLLELNKIASQRDDLLAALEGMEQSLFELEELHPVLIGAVLAKVRTAIAKAKGV